MKLKNERELLRRYMSGLYRHFKGWEPDRVSSSLCEVYDRLERPRRRLFAFAFAYSLAGLVVFVVNLFRRKA